MQIEKQCPVLLLIGCSFLGTKTTHNKNSYEYYGFACAELLKNKIKSVLGKEEQNPGEDKLIMACAVCFQKKKVNL